MIPDNERFARAIQAAQTERNSNYGIGTLSEKTLHAVLKHYFEPLEENREIKIDGYFADIKNGDMIIEIQTRSFNAMRKKLERFLAVSSVTVVYPIAERKWLSWIDKESGEIGSRRKSPKLGRANEAFGELYKIKHFLSSENFHFKIVMLDVDEYRLLSGWSLDKKRGSERYERIPIAINGIIDIDCPEDYKKILPSDLPQIFTSDVFAKKARMSMYKAHMALNVLEYLSVLESPGKEGRKKLYKYKERT